MIRLFKHYVPYAVLLIGLIDFVLLMVAAEGAWRLYAWQIGMDATPAATRIAQLLTFAAALSAAMVAVGAVLVIAMLVAPGATAYLLTDRFGRMMGIATAMGAATAFAGAYLSYFLDGSTGGVIVSLQAAIFLIVLVVAPRHGLLAGRRARRRAQDQAQAQAGGQLA